MSPDAIVLGSCAALYAFWKLEKRRRALSLRWPRDLMPIKIAQRCRTYFAAHGIDSYLLQGHIAVGHGQPDHDFNLRIPNEQFDRRIGVFKFLCRDNVYVAGEMFFKDAAAHLKLGNDRIATVVAVLTAPPSIYQIAWGKTWGIAVLQPSDLREFVVALKQAKAGQLVNYSGTSTILKAAFTPCVDKQALALGHEERALEAERCRDWIAAERHWRNNIEQRPDRWQSFISLSKVVGAQGRVEEAGNILSDAWSRFPLQSEVAAHAASYAQASGDTNEALRIWNEVMGRFPRKWIGYQGNVRALSSIGRVADADAFLELHAPEFPDDLSATYDLAELAERKGEWAQAEERWGRVIAMPDSKSWHYLRLCRALREQSKFAEATAILEHAARRHPDDHDIAREISRSGREFSVSAEG